MTTARYLPSRDFAAQTIEFRLMRGSAQLAAARLKFAYNVEHLKYPHAGHGAGRSEIVPAWQGAVRNHTSGRDVEAGGTPKGNAESSLDAIPKVIDFLQQGLAAR